VLKSRQHPKHNPQEIEFGGKVTADDWQSAPEDVLQV
jgi:hypothetical protein